MCFLNYFSNFVRFSQKILEVFDKEVLEEEQAKRLAPCDCQHKGELRAKILQHRSGRGG